MATRYELVRRVIAPIALVAALALIAYDTCGAEERAEVRFSVDFGDDAAAVRHVRVDLWSGGESIGYFEKRFGDDGAIAPVHWRQPVEPGALEATISVSLAGGEVVPLRRSLRAPVDGQIVIDARVPGR